MCGWLRSIFFKWLPLMEMSNDDGNAWLTGGCVGWMSTGLKFFKAELEVTVTVGQCKRINYT